jgi:4-hydroxy-tetrahydrodipicolinate synthase
MLEHTGCELRRVMQRSKSFLLLFFKKEDLLSATCLGGGAMRFAGVCGFPITPADADGRIDTAAVRRLVARMVAGGVATIGLLGSTGCAVYFSRAERRRAVEAAVDEAAGRVAVMVGVGALRTDEAVALARDAASCGAGAVLLPPVSYAPLSEDEVFAHFAAVAEAAGVPVCIYNNPATTHFTIGPALVARLSGVAGIVAVKNPAPDAGEMVARLADLRGRVPAGFSVGVSVDWRAGEALLAGFDAWYSVLAGVLPGPCMVMAEAARAGDAQRVQALDARLAPVWGLFTAHTSLRVVYAMARVLGIWDGAPPRPILPVGVEVEREVEAVLRRVSGRP